MNRLSLIFFLSLCLLQQGFSQRIQPIGEPIQLSGNFAELRPFHFHSGIDIRTGGVIGKKVRAVDDGLLVRIAVSPVGYGNALYIRHSDGTMSVYAHLDSFSPLITKVVKDYQYLHKTFKVDMYTEKYGLKVRRGEVIALSGNSGSSAGPHLHFELRDVRTGKCLNAQKYYDIPDHKAPELKTLYIFSTDRHGCQHQTGVYPLKLDAAGKYNAGVIRVPEGLFGVAVYALDKTDVASGKLGIYSASLQADGEEVSSFRLDSTSFSEGHSIYWLEDYGLYTGSGKTVYRMFGEGWDRLTGFRACDGGYIGVEKDSLVDVELSMADVKGNVSRLVFSARGTDPVEDSGDHVWYADEPNSQSVGSCTLTLCKGALFRSVKTSFSEYADTSGSACYRFISGEEPLSKDAGLVISGGRYTNKHVICLVAGKKCVPLSTRMSGGKLCAESRILGTYTVRKDTLAPEVVCKGMSGNLCRFAVSDDFTGLDRYRASVGGKWVLMAYDAKSDLLTIDVQEMKSALINDNNDEKGDKLVIEVSDKTGNCSRFEYSCRDILLEGGVQ